MTELGFRERNEIYSSYPCCVARCFADEYGGAWHEIETFKEMLKAKGIITNLPNFTNLDERRAFLESDMFSEITNRYYQALNEDEKAIFIDALSYKIVSDYVPAIGSKHQDALSLKYRKEGYDMDTPEGMKMLKTTTKIFSVLEDDSKFDHVRPEFLEEGKPALQRIKDFLEIKESFLDLPENERVSFLCSLPFDDFENPNSNLHRDVNEMKKSLLSYIDDPTDRQRVIESMAYYVEPNIEKYVDLTQQMIIEYVDDNLKLDREQRERLEIVFRTNDVFFTDYDVSTTNGMTDHVRREVTIANHSRGDTKNIILDMIHEYSHALSMANFMQDAAYHVGDTFEEGMADTFSEQVANYYFSKHRDVEIDGEIFQPSLPLVNNSCYIQENSWVKSMLYPLVETNQDKDAIQQFVFEDKNSFFDLTLGEGFSERMEHDFVGNPLDVEITQEELVSAHPTAFLSIENNNLYLQKNKLISTLTTMSQTMCAREEEVPLDGNEIIEHIEQEEIRLGQISAATYALAQDMESPKKWRERDDNLRGG